MKESPTPLSNPINASKVSWSLETQVPSQRGPARTRFLNSKVQGTECGACLYPPLKSPTHHLVPSTNSFETANAGAGQARAYARVANAPIRSAKYFNLLTPKSALHEPRPYENSATYRSHLSAAANLSVPPTAVQERQPKHDDMIKIHSVACHKLALRQNPAGLGVILLPSTTEHTCYH
jgi:hypothetical protein